MGWAERANRDRRRRERWAPKNTEAVDLKALKEAARHVPDAETLDQVLAAEPNILKRAKMRELMLPMIGTP